MLYSYTFTDDGMVICEQTGAEIPYHSKIRKYYGTNWKDFPEFKEWFALSNTARCKMKRKWKQMREYEAASESLDNVVKAISKVMDAAVDWTVPFSDCPKYTHKPIPEEDGCKKEKGETTMYANFDDMVNGAEKFYLNERLHVIYYEKEDEAERFYGIKDDVFPTTAANLVERIKSGKYVLPPEAEDYEVAYQRDVWSRIRFRDPDKKKDFTGLRDFLKKLDKAKNEARDTIVIGSLEDGLKAVKEFENFQVQ